MSRRIGAATIVFLAFCLNTAGVFSQTRGVQPPRTSPAPPPLPAGKLSFATVLEMLGTVGKGSQTYAKVEENIRSRGVDFEKSPLVVDTLKAFLAPQSLIDFIPSPPPPKIAGPLQVTCGPNECGILVNNTYQGNTEKGTKTVTGISPGNATIQVFADGFVRATKTVVLTEGAPADVSFALQPVPVVPRKTGKEFLLDTMNALGGVDGLVQSSDIEGAGELRWSEKGGEGQRWPLKISKLPTGLKLEFTDGCTINITDDGPQKAECKGKLKGREAVANEAAKYFSDSRMDAVMQKLMKRSLTISLESDKVLQASGDGSIYHLMVGDNGFPVELIQSSASGEPLLRTLFSKYQAVGSSQQPAHIEVGPPNEAARMAFEFTILRAPVAKK